MSRRERVAIGAALALGLALRVILFSGTDLYIDTAYYWLWGERLALSYFDHPPATAWLLRVLGITGFTVVMSVATIAAAGYAGFALSNERRVGWHAAALAALLPAFLVSSVVANPDSGLFLFGLLALGLASRGRTWLAAVSLGVALLSKYPAVLLAPSLVMLAWRHGRARLLGATALALAICSPVVVWNAQHEWLSFAFQFAHGTSAAPATLRNFFELAGAELGFIGPLAFPLIAVWCAVGPRDHRAWRLAAALPLLVFFGLALVSRQEPNWPALCAVAGTPGIVVWLWNKPTLRLATLLSAAAISVAGAAFLTLPSRWAANSDPIRRLHGNAVLATLPTQGIDAVYSPHYGLSSQIAYYAHVPVGTWSDRVSQFSVWPVPTVQRGHDALWVSEGAPPPEGGSAGFERVEGPTIIEGRFGDLVIHRWHVWRLVSAR